MMPLSPAEFSRYARHLSLSEVGLLGQEKLRAAKVLIVGAGGLGSPAALYLAAAGVGTLGLVDDDQVDLANLQRQILHGTGTLGRPKLESAAARIQDLNPEVKLRLFPVRLDSHNALDILGQFDLTLDGTDNFPTRYLINDASVLLGKPYLYGSIFRFEGQVSVLGAPGGPCYRCLFPAPPPPGLIPNCAEAGVLGVLPGVIGTLQATEAIKLVLNLGEPLIGRLLLYDALTARFRELGIVRNPSCPVCGDQPSVTELIDYPAFCGLAAPSIGREISTTELAALVPAGDRVVVVDVREKWEWDFVRMPMAVHIPLSQLGARMGELDRSVELVAVCHFGARSLAAQELLAAGGFRARSLAGGIDAWAAEIAPGMARY